MLIDSVLVLLYFLFQFKSVEFDGFHMTEAVSCGMLILLCCCEPGP